MMAINEKWIVIGLVGAVILYFLLSKEKEGFQSPTQKNANTDVKTQICTILNDTHTAVKFNYDNIDNTNPKNKDVIGLHLENIQKQIVAQGC